MSRLTQRLVDSLQPEGRDRIVFDDTLSGFGVRVFRSGRKSFVIQYRSQKRTRRYTLGDCALFTPSEARKKAATLLACIRDGEDPAESRLEALAAPSVTALAERFLRDHSAKKKTAYEDRRIVEKYILPTLGRYLVQAVTARDIDRMHAENGERAPIQANRILAVLNTMFKLAERWSLRPEGSNPCRHVKRFRENRRERFLSAAELTRLGAALREVEVEGRIGSGMVAAIRLLILTGARLGEVRNLRWDEVDVEAGVLRLRDSKTGPKVIRLNAPALGLLARLERQHTVWVFPGASGTQPIELRSAWKRIRARAELQGVRLHDLRHTYASAGVNAGMSLPVIGALLGHTRVETTRRYAHLSDDPIREASERIGATISAALDGSPPAEVVPLRSA